LFHDVCAVPVPFWKVPTAIEVEEAVEGRPGEGTCGAEGVVVIFDSQVSHALSLSASTLSDHSC